MGQLPEGAVTLVETPDDVDKFTAPEGKSLGFVTQTTLSVDDTADVINRMQERFPDIQAPAAESICYATTNRQESVKAAAPDTDYFLIVGAPNSSNSKRLVEVAKRAGAKHSALVQNANEINWDDMLKQDNLRVGLSAGASAPEILINEIIETFKDKFELKLTLAETVIEDEEFMVMRDLRDVELKPQDMAFVNGTA